MRGRHSLQEEETVCVCTKACGHERTQTETKGCVGRMMQIRLTRQIRVALKCASTLSPKLKLCFEYHSKVFTRRMA